MDKKYVLDMINRDCLFRIICMNLNKILEQEYVKERIPLTNETTTINIHTNRVLALYINAGTIRVKLYGHNNVVGLYMLTIWPNKYVTYGISEIVPSHLVGKIAAMWENTFRETTKVVK